MPNEVNCLFRFQFICLIFLLFLNNINTEIVVKLSHNLHDEAAKKAFYKRLDDHKEKYRLAGKMSFLRSEAETLRFKSEESMSLSEKAEMERRFGKALMTLTNYKDSQYVADFKVGEPPQYHKIMFDTGSSNFWLTSIKCKDIGCLKHKGYDGLKSKYYLDLHKKLAVQFGSGKVEGIFVKDKVEFGPLTIYDQEFGLIEHEEGEIFETLKFSGILGLSFPKLSHARAIPFFDNVINNSLLKKNIFSLYLTKHQENADAQIILGEPSSKYYHGKIVWHRVIQENYWTIKLDDVYVGGRKMNFCGKHGCKAVVDSGTSIITSPNKFFDKLMKAMNIDKCKNRNIYRHLPDLVFKINGHNYALTKKDYIYEKYEDDNNPGCRDGFLPLDLPPPKGPIWVLGDLFMRKFFVVHDRDNRRIGLARRKEGVKTSKEHKVTITTDHH